MQEDDAMLIAKVLKGQQSAFRTLVERYQNYVFTVTHRILPNRQEAEEAAQDAFLKAYKMLDSFEQKSKFSTWLYTIAYRSAIDILRSKKQNTHSLDDEESFLQIEDTADDPEEQLEQADLHELLRREIQQLKPEDAAIVTLFYLQEKQVKEIATITGFTESNIKVKLYRLRDKLKDQLSQHLPTEIRDIYES